jgi:apolipoprotein N-acyltransferase
MDLAVAGDMRSGFELIGLTFFVGEPATGFGHQQGTCRHIPGLYSMATAVFPVCVEPTTGDPGQVEGRRAHPSGASRPGQNFLQDLQVGPCVLATVVRESCDQDRVFHRRCVGYMDRPFVDRGPFTLRCDELLVSRGVDYHSDQRLAVVPESDGDGDLRYSIHVVDGSVKRVDDPDSTLTPVSAPALFPEDAVVGEVARYDVPNGAFGVLIDLRHRIDGSLHLGIEGVEKACLDYVSSGSGGSHRYPYVTFPHAEGLYFFTLPAVKAAALSLIAAAVSVLAFPPFGPGWLIILGVTLFLVSLRLADTRRRGLLLASLYGIAFFGGLMWWLIELELIALILVPVQGAFLAVYGWWLPRYNDRPPLVWLGLAVGGWAVMELFRYQLPVGGLEWGAAGYALSDSVITRFPAAIVGTSGLTLVVVFVGGLLALRATGDWSHRLWQLGLAVFSLLFVSTLWVWAQGSGSDGEPIEVAIVQGSTPCPFEKCPPNERLRTYQQHLRLTEQIPAGSADLVVWSEGSTGSTNADPVLVPEIGEAIGAQTARIGAWFLVGGDRSISDTNWINANVVFSPTGEIVGEYRKQHPVPFGEYVPLRSIFGLIPATDRVPRDMIRGDGPVVFDTGRFDLGSVISFEGGFSRYALQHRRAGADLMVVATNEGSYGMAPTADQFIGMTRMRAVELGVPVVHAAVTGKSTVIDAYGDFREKTGLGTSEIYTETVTASFGTPFSLIGNAVIWIAAIGAVVLWWRVRALVGSDPATPEEGTVNDAGA